MNWFEVTEWFLKAILLLLGTGFAMTGLGALIVAILDTIRNIRHSGSRTKFVWLIYLIGILMCLASAMIVSLILRPWHVQ